MIIIIIRLVKKIHIISKNKKKNEIKKNVDFQIFNKRRIEIDKILFILINKKINFRNINKVKKIY